MKSELQEKMIVKIKAHLPEGMISNCPVCKSKGIFAIGANLCGLQKFEDSMIIPGGPIVPLVPVICTTCGYTMLFNALYLGIIDESGKLAI